MRIVCVGVKDVELDEFQIFKMRVDADVHSLVRQIPEHLATLESDNTIVEINWISRIERRKTPGRISKLLYIIPTVSIQIARLVDAE